MRYADKVKQSQQRREELIDEAKDLSDERLLSDVLAFEDLEELEKTAFQSMDDRLSKRGSTGLSPRQRAWLENVYVKIGFAAEGAPSLLANGKVPRGNVPTFAWELNKPLKPPGQ